MYVTPIQLIQETTPENVCQLCFQSSTTNGEAIFYLTDTFTDSGTYLFTQVFCANATAHSIDGTEFVVCDIKEEVVANGTVQSITVRAKQLDGTNCSNGTVINLMVSGCLL